MQLANIIGALIFIAFCFGLILLVKKVQESIATSVQPQEPLLPYNKKQYFLTRAENNVLKQLEQIVGDKYYIFPQVHYSKIMYANGAQNFRNPWFNKIDRKSADFVLFDKINVSPVLVIEIDDSTHRRFDRMERDNFVDKVLERCNIPIVHVKPFTHEEALRAQIASKIKI